MPEAVVPVVLLDALFRLTTYEPRPTSVLPVFVPVTCDTIHLPERRIEPGEPLGLEVGRRSVTEQFIRTDWAEARDRGGRVVLRAEGLVGKRVGAITVNLESGEGKEQS